MTYQQFNNLEAYLTNEMNAGALQEIGRYGFENCGCGDLIYTAEAIKAAHHFSTDLEEIYEAYDLNPLEGFTSYDIDEIAVHMLYGAIEATCWRYNVALEEALNDLEKMADEFIIEWDEVSEDVHELLYTHYYEGDADPYQELLEVGREYFSDLVEKPSNNYIKLRLLGCGGALITLDGVHVFEVMDAWDAFREDYAGAFEVLGGRIHGRVVKYWGDVEEILNEYR